MALNKYSLRELLELTTETNTDMRYGPGSVRGMTITKEIIPTKANVSNTDLRKFLVVHPHEFVFNPRTHGKKIGFGYNRTDAAFLISWNNIAFRVKPEMKSTVMDEYLFLHFNREEWDREACFRSWGSSTEVFSWDALCEMELQLPPLPIQKKYVDIYNAMLANQQSYERGLEDLNIACMGYIEKLRRSSETFPIGDFIEPYIEKNVDGAITLEQGINIDKQFITPQRSNSNLTGRRIVRHGMFAYCTQLNNENVAIAYRTGEDCVVSSVYDIFRITREDRLLPEYLILWLIRPEFGRYVYWASEGSAYEFLNYDNLANYKIPVPDLTIQHAVGDIYLSYVDRKQINNHLKECIKSMCPILIKGSIEEAGV